MRATAASLPREQRLALFERALSALWGRTYRTLGEVTLSAIVDRVLHDVAEDHPLVSALEMVPGGFRVGELASGDLDNLDEAIEVTLTELLTVIGNLTADILTPGLHATLSSVSLADGSTAETGGSKS